MFQFKTTKIYNLLLSFQSTLLDMWQEGHAIDRQHVTSQCREIASHVDRKLEKYNESIAYPLLQIQNQLAERTHHDRV